MNYTDIGFMLICAAMVMVMTPALALFYGGLVRAKNILSTSMHSYILMGIIPVLWAILGYSLAFGPDQFGLIGDFSFVMLNNVGIEGGPVDNIPHLLFMIFQCMFAVLTIALISGAYAERIRFSAMLLISVLWLFLVYSPMAHWVWGGGWLFELGAVDFAGGAVVHMASAAAALAIAQKLGFRKASIDAPTPHNLPLTLLGAGLLWFGWFGFNAGSALAANELAVHAFVTTQLAAAAGVVGWIIVEWWRTGKPTTLGAASGALAGLVAITPAAGFVPISSSILIGLIGGFVCYLGIFVKEKFKFDDVLDVVGIHGIGGTWGAFATGVFAEESINGVSGILYGDVNQLWVQVVSIFATWIFVYIMTMIILFVVDKIVKIRVDEKSEIIGLDISEHNEHAYKI